MKPLLSNKIASKIIKTDQANAEVFNNFFSNIIKNLGIPQYNQVDPICQHEKDPVIKKPSLNTGIILVLLQSNKGVLIRNSVSDSLKKIF